MRELAISPTAYPYPRALLLTADAFEVWPLDGGAFFFLADHLGTATGRGCLAALLDGRLLAPWQATPSDPIDWDRAWDAPGPGPLGRPIERHVWVNRLYFLLPLALEFLRTREARHARRWADLFRSWSHAHPPPTRAGLPAAETKYVWFDMQVAWRLNVLVHSCRLLGGSSAVTGATGRAVRDAIALHADILCHETEAALAKPPPAPGAAVGNHLLHKANALLTAGVLLPRCVRDRGRCRTLGAAAMLRHLRHDVHADGGNVESSPSYSHFIARLYAEGLHLLDASDGSRTSDVRRSVRRQYDFLAAVAGPDGRSLQVNDSYALDVARDREIAGHLLDLPRTPRPASARFRDSRWATVRTATFDVYVDASPATLYHHHAGRPNLVAFAGGAPLLADGGCCNYDRGAWAGWHRTAAAHNVLLVAANGTAGEGREPAWLSNPGDVRIVRASATAVVTEARWDEAGLTCTWRRTVRARGRTLEIRDEVTASRPVIARQLFHLGTPDVVPDRDGGGATVYLDRSTVRVRSAGASDAPVRLAFRPGMDRSNAPSHVAELSREMSGRQVRFITRFVLGSVRSRSDVARAAAPEQARRPLQRPR